MLRTLLAATLLTTLVFHAGCQTNAPAKPTGTSTATLSTTSRRETLATKVGMEIRIELPPAEAGHVWTIMQHDPRFLRPVGEISKPSAANGRSIVAFHAISTGRTQLKFLAVPADGTPEVLPVDFYDIAVTIE